MLAAGMEAGDMSECINEGMIPCSRFHDTDLKNCYLIFCLDCGKDIARGCEAA
jgi:hypothetical protein